MGEDWRERCFLSLMISAHILLCRDHAGMNRSVLSVHQPHKWEHPSASIVRTGSHKQNPSPAPPCYALKAFSMWKSSSRRTCACCFQELSDLTFWAEGHKSLGMLSGQHDSARPGGSSQPVNAPLARGQFPPPTLAFREVSFLLNPSSLHLALPKSVTAMKRMRITEKKTLTIGYHTASHLQQQQCKAEGTSKQAGVWKIQKNKKAVSRGFLL